MKTLSKTLHVITLFLLISLPIYGQVESPPSLALGVAGVVGEKGSIDVDLLAEIISEKQGELKQEFIKKTFFNDLENHSYAVWEFTYRSINVLLESESKDAIKKNLLESASNLALVYGFSELYLQLSRRMCHSALDSLLLQFDSDYKKDRIFICKAGATPVGASIKLHELKKYSIVIDNQELNFSAVFADLVYEILTTNEDVSKELGFLVTAPPLGTEYYQQHSAYYRVDKIDSLKQPLHHLKKRITKEVALLLDNFILLRKIIRSELSLNNLIVSYESVMTEITTRRMGPNAKFVTSDGQAKLFTTLARETDSLYDDLQKMKQNVETTIAGGIIVGESISENKELSKAIAENLAAFNNFIAKGHKFDQFDIFYLEKSITPLLVRLVAEKGFNSKYLQVAEDFEKLITYQLLKNLQVQLKDSSNNAENFSELADTPLSSFRELLEFITRLDELDKVETYQFVLQTIQTVSELFSDRNLGIYLKTLIENINTYTILNEEEKKVEIAVEDIITRIYEKYSNRQSSIFSLYFSIGLNQSIDSDFKYQRLLPNSAKDTTIELNSLAFASEKIGLKVKLIDIKWRRSFSVGETYYSRVAKRPHTVTRFQSNKPLVSDLYFVTYLSGLLYKVANLTTHDEFKDPIAGIGLGIAFFNSLDLNIGYNWPLQSNNDFFESFAKQRIWTVGFDVKITEYLTAVGKKRKEKN